MNLLIYLIGWALITIIYLLSVFSIRNHYEERLNAIESDWYLLLEQNQKQWEQIYSEKESECATDVRKEDEGK